MSLLNALATILARLGKDEFANEEAIKSRVSFSPFSPVWAGTRLTPPLFARSTAFHPAVWTTRFATLPRTAVFIEVKQPGQTSAADKQFFEYAFHEGVPRAVLISLGVRRPLSGRPDFAQNLDMHVQVVPGWLLITNFSNQMKRSILALAATVASVRIREGEDYSL
jgi:hypothetical protein